MKELSAWKSIYHHHREVCCSYLPRWYISSMTMVD